MLFNNLVIIPPSVFTYQGGVFSSDVLRIRANLMNFGYLYMQA